MSAPRKVCVVTGSRADYGLLHWLMKEIQADAQLELQVVATGMHLSPEFGLTYRQIEADGFHIAAKVETLLSSDTAVATTKSVGLGVIGFAEALERLRPDILLVLGDRFEVLAAVQAALFARVPTAHIHGGERSEDAFDESIRHAITKMSHWHFVAAEPYRKRVVQMGEAPETVFNYGAPGLDQLARVAWMSRAQLEEELGMALRSPLLLVTYHPVTLADVSPEQPMAELLAALERLGDATVVFTYPNADTGGRVLIRCIDGFVARHPARARAFASLGERRYLSLMREADAIVGNSSSGLTEAPALKKATVNIGNRQKGRLKASSVIDCAEDREGIGRAIALALSDAFRAALPSTDSPYGRGGASRAIVEQLKRPLPRIQKPFFDVDHAY